MTEAPFQHRPQRRQQLRLLGLWMFPYVLAASAYGLSFTLASADALRSPVFAWPVDAKVYGWLLLMVLLSGAWLVAEFMTVTNRETVVLVPGIISR